MDITIGEMEDNPTAACVTGTKIWSDIFKFLSVLMDTTSLVESEYILLQQSLNTLFDLSGKAPDKADRRAVADKIIQHQQPPRCPDSHSFLDDHAQIAARLHGVLARDASAFGLPIWGKIAQKKQNSRWC